MKNTIIIFLFCFQMTAFSQITFENTYSGSAGLSMVNESTLRYYNYDVNTNQCIVYNEQHQAIKYITLPLNSTQYLYSITYLSENLFNSDSKLEFIYTYNEWFQVDTTWYLEYNSNVITEDGTILVSIPGCQYTSVTNKTLGSKLMAWLYDYSVSTYAFETRVFNLPGNYSETDEIKSAEDSHAWPNPCSQFIYLPINEDINSIRIYSENGQLMDEIKTLAHESSLKYTVNHLGAGIYFYETTNENGNSKKNKFIIR